RHVPAEMARRADARHGRHQRALARHSADLRCAGGFLASHCAGVLGEPAAGGSTRFAGRARRDLPVHPFRRAARRRAGRGVSDPGAARRAADRLDRARLGAECPAIDRTRDRADWIPADPARLKRRTAADLRVAILGLAARIAYFPHNSHNIRWLKEAWKQTACKTPWTRLSPRCG